jgi:hypothetical protein
MWPAAAFDPYSPRPSVSSAILSSFGAISSHIRSVIGFISPSSLVFLDTRLWICSVDIQSIFGKGEGNVSDRQYSIPSIGIRRHFFALSEWCDAEGEIKCSLIAVPGTAVQSMDHRVVFVSGHKLVVVKGGFQFSELMPA